MASITAQDARNLTLKRAIDVLHVVCRIYDSRRSGKKSTYIRLSWVQKGGSSHQTGDFRIWYFPDFLPIRVLDDQSSNLAEFHLQNRYEVHI